MNATGQESTYQPIVSAHALAVVMVASVVGMALVCMTVCALALLAHWFGGRR